LNTTVHATPAKKEHTLNTEDARSSHPARHRGDANTMPAKMRPGECRCTKGGVKYCYIPGKGVRFTGRC
jgi:hypothetical protein